MGRKAVKYLLFYLAVFATLLLAAASVVSWRASYVSPEEGGFWVAMAMALPLVLLFNVAAFVWWMIRARWGIALIPLAAILFNMGYVSSMIRLPEIRLQRELSDLSVATLNANGFRRLGPVEVTASAVARLMQREGVDVVCLQEFLGSREYPADSIAARFAARAGMRYSMQEGSQAIYSRYPLFDKHYIRFPETDNDYLRADMLFGGDTVRVVSVHLQTSGVSQLRRRFREDYGRDAPVEAVLDEVSGNSRIRAQQVREIRSLTDASPYPVLLVGDFNDTPSSYTYRTMKGDLTDGFRARGHGYGGTFRYLGGLLRIDYIFYDEHFSGVRYRTLKDDVSDHKLVIADLRYLP